MEHFNEDRPSQPLVEEVKKKLCFVMPSEAARSQYARQPPAPRAVANAAGEALPPLGSVLYE